MIELAQKLGKIAETIKDSDAKNAVADLRLALAESRLQMAELIDENLKLRRQLEDAGPVRKSTAWAVLPEVF